MSSGIVFALDIGTRKVMGVLARQDSECLTVLDCETIEHATRAMDSGQIQDVPRVAEAVRLVAARLSKRAGATLDRAAVAVAGRNLKTLRGEAVLRWPSRESGTALCEAHVIDEEDLNLSSQQALEATFKQNGFGDASQGAFHCVGYVATRHKVDGEPIRDPRGHVAQSLEAEVLATFLPRRVLDGLFAVLKQAGLEAHCVTLEPIAALQSAVPEAFKRFNLALVDVGAGTSDIAIVSDGCVSAFGMVPCAGDFITESLSDSYLLDFFVAERLKRSLGAGGALEVVDIFERTRQLDCAEGLEALRAPVESLARRIADHVLQLNGQAAPQAVICVGGGSLTPGLESALGRALGLSPDRIGKRAPVSIRVAAEQPRHAMGPETATPLGIAMVAHLHRGLSFRKVILNGQFVHALETARPLTVLSALISAGVASDRIYGRPGPSKTITINGALTVIRGSAGRPAKIQVNGGSGTLSQILNDGDRIEFEDAAAGLEACATLAEALEDHACRVALGGEIRKAYPAATINGQEAGPQSDVPDRARIVYRPWLDARELANQAFGPDLPSRFLLKRRGQAIEEAPRAGDLIEIEPLAEDLPRREPHSAPPRSVRVKINDAEVVLTGPCDPPAMLFDLFRHIDIDAQRAVGRRLRLVLNGENAGFTSPLHDGAEVKVYFE